MAGRPLRTLELQVVEIKETSEGFSWKTCIVRAFLGRRASIKAMDLINLI